MKKIFLIFSFVLFLCSSISVLAENQDANCIEINSDDFLKCEIENQYNNRPVVLSTDYSDASYEYNIVKYDVDSKETELINLDNSLSTAESSIVNSNYVCQVDSSNYYTYNDLLPISNTMLSPYRYVAKIIVYFDNVPIPGTNQTTSAWYPTTAFAIEKNSLLTAGHCTYCDITVGDLDDGIINRRFADRIQVIFGSYMSNGEVQSPYFDEEEIYAKEICINREYSMEYSVANDWAIININEDIYNELGGYFNRASGYNILNADANFYGYPKDYVPSSYKGNMYESSGKVIECSLSDNFVKVSAYTTGGMSGSPILTEINGVLYVVGVVCTKYPYLGSNYNISATAGCLISSLCFDLINFIRFEDDPVQLRDFYYVGQTKIRYNTMVELIVNPSENMSVDFTTSSYNNYKYYTELTQEFYTSKSTSTSMNFPWALYRTHDLLTQTYTSWTNINTLSEQSRTAEYPVVNKTSSGDIISTTFDQSDNIWYHNGAAGDIIKGTIAYGNYAKNIEVIIPSSGTNLSEMVTVGGVSFQLRTGPYRVSIKASTSVTCGSVNNIFAFGLKEV